MRHHFLFGFCLFLSSFVQAQLSDRYAVLPDWYEDYDVKFYKIDIEADNTTSDIAGYAEIHAEIKKNGLKQFTLELAEGIRVDSVQMTGQRISFRREKDNLYVLCTSPLRAGTMCHVSVYYAAHNIKGDGFFSAVGNRTNSEWDIPVTWTLSEPYNAKKWFPCKQYLPDKADSAYIFITVPKRLKAGAPGILTAVTPMLGNKSRYEWKTRYPTAYYLLSFAVSDYDDYTVYAHPKGVKNPVPIQNYIYARDGYLEANKAIIDTTKALIELYSELYLPYPFAEEKYGHCVAPMGGGMEHQTMTTLSDFDFLLVAHELAHQWFGDLVTCASFQDVWINEGFTTYTEFLTLEHLASREEAMEWMREAHSMACWSSKGSVFVPKESAYDIWRIFSMNLSYKKGAILVHGIRYIINDDQKFFNVLRGFLRKYAFSVATADDFKKFAEKETGIDFTRFFDQWYYGEGFPIIDISWKKEGKKVDILVEHTGSSSSNPLFITDLDILLRKNNGSDTLIRAHIDAGRKEFHYSFADNNISEIEIDPGYHVLKSLRNVSRVKDFPTNDQFVFCNTQIKRKQDLEIRFKTETARDCRIRLTDVSGENTFFETIAKRKKMLTIPMTELSDGTYMLYVDNGKNRYIRKILKTAY